MVYSDGSLGAGFRLSGVDISTATSDTINEITSQLENLINTAQEGLRFQIFYRATPHVEQLISGHEELTKGGDESYDTIAAARVAFLRAEANSGAFVSPEIYFFVRSQPHRYRRQKLWESVREFQSLSEKEYGDHKSKFERNLSQLQSSLGHSRLSPTRLSVKEWFKLLYEYLNLPRSEKLDAPEIRNSSGPFGAPFSDQLTLTDLEVHRDHIRFGDHLFRVLTLKTLPEGESHASMVDSFLKIPFFYWVSQTVTIPDQKKEVEKLQLQRRLAHSMASGAKNVSDLESESKLAHIEELLSELLEGSEKIVLTDFNVIVWAKDLNELEEKTDEVLKAFRNLNQSEGVSETLPCLDAFLQSAPGVCVPFRQKKVKSSNAAHLMPVFSYWRGNERPVCVIPNRDGGLVSVDIFSNRLPAWNGMIFGSTGSGKSMSVLQLILMFYGQKPRPKAVWIDNGASSKRAIEVLGGEFIDLNIDSKIRLNVFDLPEGETKPSPSKVKLILAVLETILKDDDQTGLPKRDKALIEEAIFACYKQSKGRSPTLSDLRGILNAHSAASLRAYSEILFSWTGDTAYGRLLDGQSNVKLTKDLTTIEIKGLDSYPELQNVFLLLFTDFIQVEAAKDISRPFLLIIDEAWRLFQTVAGMAFSLEAYRTFRKFHAGIWSISQNYRDFLSNEEIAAAVLPNTTSIFVLKQRGIDWEDLAKRLGLNPAELEAVKGLQIQKGEYTEVFYLQDENRSILRLTPDPLTYWICTSDPKDKSKIEEVKNRNPEMDILEVLQTLVAEQAEQKLKAAA